MASAISRKQLLKICGIRDPITAGVAAQAGATAIGVMFAPSRRRVDPETARDIKGDVGVPLVGVVVNETAKSLDELIERSMIDMVQLSGDETPDLLEHIPIPVIKAIRLRPGQDIDDAARVIDPWLDHHHPVEAVMLDAHSEGHYGGTGLLADWTIASKLAERYPLILAGGLTAENVSDGVRRVAPIGVDVSSGVETDGVKDHQKIRAFIAAFHEATSAMTRS